MTAGVLTLVPTPLGNAEDLSPRARQLLEAVDVIAAEDTREIRALLARLDLHVHAHLVSYHDHNEGSRAPELVGRLRAGQSVALVSDAGTPVWSDPGYELVRAVLDEGLEVVALPGPVAAVTALVASGLPPQNACFLGFLPRREGARRETIERFARHPGTLMIYESPHRVKEVLSSLFETLGDRRAVIGWNLTKRDERYLRGTLGALVAELASWPEVRGEFTILVGAGEPDPAQALAAAQAAIARLGAWPPPRKELAALLAGLLDVPTREVYQALLEL